tara:strand:+ start:808 stop:1290 length:483 start_codon:yes stop_codon:yes gene_type:complete
MNEATRLNLRKMVKEYGAEETTSKIRECKHSKYIRKDIRTMIMTKQKYKRLDKKMLNQMIENQCSFLKNNYTNIYNKLKNDIIDVKMLLKFVDVLESIETSKYDQHEASAQIGQILKEIYIDSALKEDKKRDNMVKKKEKKRKIKNISWKEYKQKMIQTE